MGCCEAKSDTASSFENLGSNTQCSSKAPGLTVAFKPELQADEEYPTLMLTIGKQDEYTSTTKERLDTKINGVEKATSKEKCEIAKIQEGTEDRQHVALAPEVEVKSAQPKPALAKAQQDANLVPRSEKPKELQLHEPPAQEAQVSQGEPKENAQTFDEISDALRDPARAAKVRAIPDRTKLEMYALFKQGSCGNCSTSRPGWTDMKGRAKWDAWKAKQGMSHDDAKEAYVELVTGLKVL